jgi:hypothetical protein
MPDHNPRSAPSALSPSALSASSSAPSAFASDGDRIHAAQSAARSVENRRWGRRLGFIAAAVLLLTGGAITAVALMPTPVPDALNDDMDDVLAFALTSDEFNELPLDERLKLIRDLVQRFKTMSGADSAAMAAFASTIEGRIRKQMEKNVKRLGVDLMDYYAAGYAGVPTEKQGDYLDEAILNMTRLMEELSGEDTGLPDDDEERMAALSKQAQRDQAWMERNRPRDMEAGRVVPFIEFLQRDASQVAGPDQRSRVTKFGRDLTRHLRDQDISTGEPK